MTDRLPDAGLHSLVTAGGDLLRMRDADVGRSREALRTRRWAKLTLVVWLVLALITWRRLSLSAGEAFLSIPSVDPLTAVPIAFFVLLMVMLVGQQAMTGRSPHVVYRSDQIDTRLADVVGIDPVKDEAIRSLNLFLAHKTYSTAMGGTPRRGLLFEGSPGTGKTFLARAMAAEAGVPFLFASGTSFQTVWQGQSSKKIRSYFKALRKAARKEGGAIGFIEELDVIALSRSGVRTSATPLVASLAASHCSGTSSLPASFAAAPGGGSVVHGFAGGGDNATIINELLVQMQSFDALTGGERLCGWAVDRVNLLLPVHLQLKRPVVKPVNVLVIAATNRADALDPALLRPGRFDRRLSFELPDKAGRRALLDHYLAKKSHAPELDDTERRDALAAITTGFSPVMVENLLDEALVSAVRRGDTRMTWADVEDARLSTQIGSGQPVSYTPHETRLIATHEAGHATVAWLTAPQRRLEVLTIIRRKGSLGLLAHGDREDVYTRSRSELEALVQIALGGQCAEELFFGDVSTGPAGDLLYATNCAAEMVGAHGMDGSLISYMAIQNSGFSDTNIVGRVLADDRGRDAVEALLQRHKVTVQGLLSDHRHLVEALRDALVERHELVGHEITDVLQAAHATVAAPVVVDLRDPLADQADAPTP